jgi:hypothetical protein
MRPVAHVLQQWWESRSDRGLRAAQVEAKGTQLRLTEASIIPQLLYDVRCLLQYVSDSRPGECFILSSHVQMSKRVVKDTK